MALKPISDVRFEQESRQIIDENFQAVETEIAAISEAVRGVGVFDVVEPNAAIPYACSRGAAISYRENGAAVSADEEFLTSGTGAGQRAWYGEFPVGQKITKIGAEFKFTAGSGGKNGAIALVPWSASVTDTADIPPTPLHFTVSRFGWSVGVLTVENGVITLIGSGSFETLAADTTYRAEAVIDGSSAFLSLPDGSTATVTDPVLASVVGLYAGFEFYQFDGATDDRVKIGRVWAGTGDQNASGASSLVAAGRKYSRVPSAKSLTSVAASSIPTSEGLIDAAAVAYVPKGNQNKNVLCRLSAWLNVIAGHSVIFAPKFVDATGALISQPFLFAVTAPTGGFSGYAQVEFVQEVTSDLPVNCEFRYLSTGAGDTVTAAANKPVTMSFTALG